MRSQPGAQQRLETPDRVDVDFTKAIAVFVASEFTAPVAALPVAVAPLRQSVVAITREDGVGQVVKVAAAGFTVMALMEPAPPDLFGLAPGTSDTLRPAQLADTLVARGVVDEVVDPEHMRSMFISVSLSNS